MDLFPTAGNTATAMSGMGDIAIAIGNGSEAIATVGTFDSAFADGEATLASSGKGEFDSATAIGNNSHADASAGNGDSATVFGPGSVATADFGNDDLASVVNTGNASDVADAGGTSINVLGSNDIASVLGTGSLAEAGANVTAPAISTSPPPSATPSSRTLSAPATWRHVRGIAFTVVVSIPALVRAIRLARRFDRRQRFEVLTAVGIASANPQSRRRILASLRRWMRVGSRVSTICSQRRLTTR